VKKNSWIILLLVLTLASCSTIPEVIPDVIDTADKIVEDSVKAGTEAGKITEKIIEIEKTVDRIVYLTDGEAKQEAVKLSIQVAEMLAENRAHETTIKTLTGNAEKLDGQITDLNKEVFKLRKIEEKYKNMWLIISFIAFILVAGAAFRLLIK
jgi:seryl-tRNA synthetase